MGICKLTYVLRCSPQAFVGEGVEVFDSHLHAALRRIVVGDGGGYGPLQDELPLDEGGLGISRGVDIAPVAYLASVLQTLPVQDDMLVNWGVPLVAAVLGAKEAFCETLPSFSPSILDDPDL